MTPGAYSAIFIFRLLNITLAYHMSTQVFGIIVLEIYICTSQLTNQLFQFDKDVKSISRTTHYTV